MKNSKLQLITAAALTTILIGAVAPTITAKTATADGTSGTGTATLTLAPGSLNFVSVPEFNFGSHNITASMTGLSVTSPVTADLTVEDYRGYQAPVYEADGTTLASGNADAGYHVDAAVANGANGFTGTKGQGPLTTVNFAVTLADSITGNKGLKGLASPDITATDHIAAGTAGVALGQEKTEGGTASIDITNGSLIADTYLATVNYTLVAGV